MREAMWVLRPSLVQGGSTVNAAMDPGFGPQSQCLGSNDAHYISHQLWQLWPRGHPQGVMYLSGEFPSGTTTELM